IFFFSSRRRHTRCYRDWSSDVCSSDLQVSLTSGTVLHNTKTPLTLWLWAAYLMTTDKRGVSALLLQRQLGFRRYETAWMILHKRSEERRVGKESRSRWTSTHEHKQA